ncbi:hypothetical protein HanXRQr2_Chr10g0423421 [Helianthus annuus]|uniref:Uncharacterized protein n=1 Tax=Helianthus annuus TaxID=4232 RepID=A0A251TH88_HELAN|nr:hypothetical protein HanXRQr2_Chr10g0423421 [Helianthus annuus]
MYQPHLFPNRHNFRFFKILFIPSTAISFKSPNLKRSSTETKFISHYYLLISFSVVQIHSDIAALHSRSNSTSLHSRSTSNKLEHN